ncbi:Mechanosensitive ion channel protein [Leptospira interrogans serovar Canicola]|nr:Mechanosensitive ion channel protein [Leptospira interrogans serovar Canicola]
MEFFSEIKFQLPIRFTKREEKSSVYFFYLLSSFLFLKFLKLTSVESVFLGFKILSIVLCTISLSHLFSAVFETKTEGMVSSASIIGNAIRIILFTVCILLILQSLGISIVPILGALGVGGLAVALGLQPTLSNLFSGLGILLGKQLKRGDYVRMQGEGLEGYVQDITWRSTTIRKRNDSVIVVPNSVMASSVVTTLELSKKMFFDSNRSKYKFSNRFGKSRVTRHKHRK